MKQYIQKTLASSKDDNDKAAEYYTFITKIMT